MKFVVIFLLLMSSQLMAIEAVVIVLEAPILFSPSLNSSVKQIARKGQKVYLHDQHFNESEWESTSIISERVQLVDPDFNEEFYQTKTKDGGSGYIQAKYVKVIYADSRERNDPVARFKVDPTDYRLEEPLAADYPLSERDKKKALALFSFGSHAKSSYPFIQQISDEDISSALGVQLIYAGKVSYDLLDRFYFGAKFSYDNFDSELTFQNTEQVTQSIGRFMAGPWISYDIYKSEKFRLTSFGSLQLTYHRAYLTYEALLEQVEERIFSAWSVTPEIGAQFQVIEVVPSVDVVLGSYLTFQPALELRSSTEAEGNFWNDERDSIQVGSGLNAMFTVGIQSRY